MPEIPTTGDTPRSPSHVCARLCGHGLVTAMLVWALLVPQVATSAPISLTVDVAANVPTPLPAAGIYQDLQPHFLDPETIPPAQALFWGHKVSLYVATPALIASRPGVRADVARQIASHLQRRPLVTWADVDALPGVGPTTLAALQRSFTLEPSP